MYCDGSGCLTFLRVYCRMIEMIIRVVMPSQLLTALAVRSKCLWDVVVPNGQNTHW
ncbi:hypothetical protein XBO1_2260014 [Xenorhabdus bovienii str. oregonense]|uniref:Uncharacterized protein n=1 Tax=Xenorhabdus bovienii str. oregonense TaxID=1398202 RepID=A0A077P6B0_XENBV|nr:hypothetical protein XBO1_2260014 [Xenorhabdus bovienii str. oregonense]